MAAKTDWIDGNTVTAASLNALGIEINTKGTYTKPGAGIPSTDMTTAVVTSLSLANTAVQPGAVSVVTNTMMADDAVGVAELSATGTPSSTTYLRGDNTWSTSPGASIPPNSIGNTEMGDDAVGVAELSATGTPSSTTYLRGDNTWATVSGGAGGPVAAADITDSGTAGRAVIQAETAATARTAIGAAGYAPRVTTITSNATPTVNTDAADLVTITALATAITSMTTNLAGAPGNGQPLMYRIKDNGTARAITWGASFENGGATLPTTTVANKTLLVGFFYDSVDAKWACEAQGSRP